MPNFVFAGVEIFVFAAVLLFVFTANLTKLCLLQYNFFLTSNGIQDRYKARNSALGQHDLDIVDFVLLVKHLLIRYSAILR